jgi:hypothetical protein
MLLHEAVLERGEPLLLSPQKGTALFSVAFKGAKAWCGCMEVGTLLV